MLASLETPSGKGAADENFPVGSWLIRPELRGHVFALYGFARAADDIADNPHLAPDDKIERLQKMAAIIRGDIPDDQAIQLSAKTLRLRRSLHETGVTAQHALDLLTAFTQDAQKQRYRDWDDLLAYCFLSAAPIGRHLLDLHGEGPTSRRGSDALCNALQIINHLQDCGIDYRALDRVYLPVGMIEAEGASVIDLGGSALTPALRKVLDRMIQPLDGLLLTSADLVVQVADPRIALECNVIHSLAVKLTERLQHEDPIATRVSFKKPAAAALGLLAIVDGLRRRRFPPATRVHAPA